MAIKHVQNRSDCIVVIAKKIEDLHVETFIFIEPIHYEIKLGRITLKHWFRSTGRGDNRSIVHEPKVAEVAHCGYFYSAIMEAKMGCCPGSQRFQF